MTTASARGRIVLAACSAVAGWLAAAPATAQDRSAPVILQYFESSWSTMEQRMPDVFMAGYGAIWTPPPGRALDTPQGGAIGYDVYDRFDLGRAGDPTLYGTESGYKALIAQTRRMGGDVYVDFVHHHVGSWDLPAYTGNPSASGTMNSVYDYPGFKLSNVNTNDGDTYKSPPDAAPGTPQFEYQYRLANLITVDWTNPDAYVRNPVPGFADNIPTSGQLNGVGRIANLPTEENRRLYPDQQLPGRTLYDNGQAYTVYDFNTANPMAGDPTAETVAGYMMRYAQWLVQSIGVDGLRIDAARHVPIGQNGDLDARALIDRAVFGAATRTNLDGSARSVFQFQEVFNGDANVLQGFIRKDINPATPDVVGGNRDVLDFPLWFAMKDNLGSNGLTNNWYNVRNASQDARDDGLAQNGSQSIGFVVNHDEGGVHLSNVAHAFVLTRPGNAYVYYRADEFDRSAYPQLFLKGGRGDALGGVYGSAITDLVNIRNTHGRGNFLERWIDGGGFSNVYVYERDRSMVVGLNSALGTVTNFDSRTVQTNFAAGTLLVELTGNANRADVDTQSNIDDYVVVDGTGKITLRIPRNQNIEGVEHGRGYVIYGLARPNGTLSITDKHSSIAGQTPTAATNATARLASVDVVKNSTFTLRMETTAFSHAGIRDRNADGDNALFRINGGVDGNGNGVVDFVSTAPAADVVYGFEQFNDLRQSGYSQASGNGVYQQTINTAGLAEGYQYLATRVFRHSDDPTAPAVFGDFRKVIYLDRYKPISAVAAFAPTVAGVNENRAVVVQSLDQTAARVHVMLDLPAVLGDEQIKALAAQSNAAVQVDRDLFVRELTNITHGNHVLTLLTYEMDGADGTPINFNVQRLTGQYTSTIFGAGLGDVNFDTIYSTADIDLMGDLLASGNTVFNAAADLSGDGLITNWDIDLLGSRLMAVNADVATMSAYNALAATVPEPGGLMSVMALAPLLLKRRRRMN